jgi:hypothetical protein
MTEAIRAAVNENDLVNRARGETFVGRRGELAQLASIAAGVAGSGRGQLVVVAGDAGVGKSALVREFTGQLSGDGWTAAVGGCVDVTAGALTYWLGMKGLRRGWALSRWPGTTGPARLARGVGPHHRIRRGMSAGQPFISCRRGVLCARPAINLGRFQ